MEQETKKVLICPNCKRTISEGNFTVEQSYYYKVELDEDGSSWINGKVINAGDRQYPIYCDSCGATFFEFDKK